MEIRELARAVLFGGSLEEKLFVPDGLSDRDPGSAIAPPPWPTRSKRLRLDAERRAPLPGIGELEGELARGRLLHAFANHELLAAELMALTLLRFPEAPAAFREGIARTLLEEQTHLRLYLGRMAELGVELGDLPLSAYFWSSLASHRSSLEFVTTMSLTFEQANLDHALHYLEVFTSLEDPRTAEILRRVYEDEVGHVRHGLKWFNAWRDEGEGEWEAYCRLLESPLTPRRAKGKVFFARARREAGFSEAFARELEVYSSSRGRQPDVYLFNPSCEAEIADGRPGYVAPAAVGELARDLAPLLLFEAKEDDLVLLPKRPSLEFLAELQRVGVALPEVLETGEDLEAAVAKLAERPVRRVVPWGWSPRVRSLFAPVLSKLPATEQPAWDPREVSSKAFASRLLRGWLETVPELREVVGPGTGAGAVLEDVTGVRGRVRALHEISGWVVLKAPWGTSGQNQRRVEGPDLSAQDEGWLARILRRQGCVVVEPWLERIADVSFQVAVGAEGCLGRGRLTRFFTDRRGQYRGHLLGRPLAGLDSRVLRALHGDGGRAPAFLSVLASVARYAGRALAREGYRGPLGIDALVYEHEGRAHLQPLLELNPRTTMGRLALSLERLVRPGRVGLWLHVSAAELRKNGYEGIGAFAVALGAQGARMTPEPIRIERGILFTNDPACATSHLAVLAVGESLAECVGLLGPIAAGLDSGSHRTGE